MQTEKNSIKKLSVEVNTTSMKTALYYKNNFTEILKRIEPLLDDVISNYTYKNAIHYLSFENLTLNIDLTKNHSDNDLKNEILTAFRKILSIKNQSVETVKTSTIPERYIDAFFYYLEYGIKPWWFNKSTFEIDQIIPGLKNENQTIKLKSLLLTNTVKYRLIHQFEDSFLLELCAAINAKKILRKNVQNIEKLKAYRSEFWSLIFDNILEKNEIKTRDEVYALIVNLYKNKSVLNGEEAILIVNINNTINSILGKEFIEVNFSSRNKYKSYSIIFKTEPSTLKHFNKTQTTVALQKKGAKFYLERLHVYPQLKKPISETGKIENETEIYIENAGLVLLHPFLKTFFEKINLFENNSIKESNYDLAVQVLYYLATNKVQAAEHELIFEKYLCGIPAGFPLNKFVPIPQQIKTECDELLKAVLTHWKSLQSSSSELLQNEYLCRAGKLTLKNDKDLLYIQRKTQDILLEKILWNIHIIKLPWRKKLLYIEW